MSVIAWCFLFSIAPKPIMAAGETKNLGKYQGRTRFVIRTKEVLGSIALDLFAVLFGGAVALIPYMPGIS